MTLKEYMTRFLPTAPGILSVAIPAAAGLAIGTVAGPLAGALSGVGLLAALNVAAVVTGVGSRAAVGRSERLAWLDGRERLEAARKAAARLASLRLPDPDMARLAGFVALRARALVDLSERKKTRDPVAEDAVSECLEMLDLYLKELDDRSTERRYGVADDDPFKDAKARVEAGLAERVAIIEAGILRMDGGLTREDGMAIKETL